MTIRQVSAFVLALGVAVARPSAQPALPRPAPAFDPAATDALATRTIARAMAAEHIPGAAFVLVKDGAVVVSKGFGVASLERQTPVDPARTIFRIGSISKALTATGLMQFVDLQKIGLDDDVNRYLTAFKVDARYPEPVRIRHLLTHTAGFDQSGDDDREFAAPGARPSLEQFLAATLKRTRPPGQVSSYDTWGMTLAGYLLERLSGVSYAAYMKASVFTPLGMTRTNVETPAALRADLATGYRYAKGAHVPQRYEYYTTLPASSIDATAADMGRLMIAMLGDGSTDGHTAFMSRHTLETYRTVMFRNAPDFPAYSYGFKDEVTNGQRVLRHGGNMLGFASDLFMLPEFGIGAFVVYNDDREIDGPAAVMRDTLYHALMDAWFPAGAGPPALRPAVASDPARFAGSYANNLYCHFCFEGDHGAWPIPGIDVVTATPDGARDALLINGNRWRFVDRLTVQSERSGNLVAFRESADGRITHLITRDAVAERLDTRLLDETLGPGWRSADPAPLAAIVYSRIGEFAACADAYESIARRRPDDATALFNAGVCRTEERDPTRALPSLNRAWTLQERPPRTAFWLGAAYGLAGDTDKAFEWLNRAVDLGFDKRRLSTEVVLAPLRADPRFAALLARQR